MIHHLYCIKLLGVVIYVGVTKNPTTRFRSHHKQKKRLGPVLRKYGERAWIETLAIGQREYIYELEIQAIIAFNTRHPNGFNIGAGGFGCRDPLPSTRAKISAANSVPSTRARISAAQLGRTRSPETRAKMSAAKIGKPGGMLGKTHPAETRAKMSAAGQKDWILRKSRP